VIEAHGLVKRYGNTAAVDELSFTIRPGMVTGFLGPNGAGKSTTMRMILGIDAPSHGAVTVNKKRYTQSPAPMHEVGALLDAGAVHGGRSARNHLLCLAQTNGIARSRVDEVLGIVGLAEVAGKRSGGFSLGMRQRLGIAQALLGAPRLLLLDEPTNGLDPQGMREVRQLLRRLADTGVTVVISSHLLFEVEATCDRVAVLAQGRLVAEGPPRSLRSQPAGLRIEVDDRARALGVLRSLTGVAVEEDGAGSIRVRLSTSATAAEVNAALVRGGVGVAALVPEQDSLEDVFVSLVKGADVPR
jgi:ABC-2 type transport system ATP-binding protein